MPCNDPGVLSDPSSRRQLLINALVMLSADPAEQRTWIEKHRVATDEFALDFDHAFRLVPALNEEGWLDADVLLDLKAIDEAFSAMSGEQNSERWSITALASDPGWTMVRETARRVLVLLVGDWRHPLPDGGVIR
jgi:hypothetical protein